MSGIRSICSRRSGVFGAVRLVSVVVAAAVISTGCNRQSGGSCSGRSSRSRSPESDYASQRKQMVENQLKGRGIDSDRVLEAMRRVPRHRFVPEPLRDQAYEDHPVPIGEGQTISQPYIVAYMTEALKLKPKDKVLEVGTGSGYQAAVLAELVKEVYTIEIVAKLARQARKVLEELGYENIDFRIGDGYQGWPDKAPFDGIMVTAAPEHIPQPLLDQLEVGGRLVMPVKNRLLRVTRTKEGYEKERLLWVRFVPMTGKAQERK